MSVNELLERIERATSAVQGTAHPLPERGAEPGATPWLDTVTGITITAMSVLLAVCGAKVGTERAELTRALLEQSRAQAEFHAQDVKHRVAVSALQQVRATLADGSPDAVRKREVLRLAGSVERYLGESRLARTWSSSFDGLVDARLRGQEGFEAAQLSIGLVLVLASMALVMRRRALWVTAVALGLAAVAFMGLTDSRTSRRVHEATLGIDRTFRSYASARERDRTTDAEVVLLADVRSWASPGAAAVR